MKKLRYLKQKCQVAVSGPKSIHLYIFFLQEVIKLKYVAKYILIGMPKAELVPKK